MQARKAQREDVERLVLLLTALRPQLDVLASQRHPSYATLEAHVRALEQELEGLIGGPMADGAKGADPRTSPFTAKVYYLLKNNPASPVSDLAESLGENAADSVKRIHNSLRTLERAGHVQKVGRGRWVTVDLPNDRTCQVCGVQFSSLIGPCPNCNMQYGARHAGEGQGR